MIIAFNINDINFASVVVVRSFGQFSVQICDFYKFPLSKGTSNTHKMLKILNFFLD